ncbi:hypothetical protein GCM10023340_11430 [Nocardioides marinquilinus]|uniref:DUF559 domain-containing protein n=1 Tax=Nocardioides marinquilinus TaxID=1210400 RepID=A0ABP9PDT3_9ACTN
MATGTCSVLEQAYLDRVVRAHGLPVGERQVSHRHAGDTRYRDVLIAGLALCVELDGRLHHGSVAARDADLDRDLDSVAVDDVLTVRLSWGQCVERACATAHRLAVVMQRRGWRGRPRACQTCRAAA